MFLGLDVYPDAEDHRFKHEQLGKDHKKLITVNQPMVGQVKADSQIVFSEGQAEGKPRHNF